MYCPICGNPCDENAAFCGNCGNPIQTNKPKKEDAQPAYQQPTQQQPAYQQPAYQQPAYQQPAYRQPAYQQPTYQQPVYQYVQPVNEPNPGNGKGIASMILSIIAVVFCWIPIYNIFSLFLAIPGLILGIIGTLQSSKAGKSKGKALVGVILSAVSLLVLFFYFILIVVASTSSY